MILVLVQDIDTCMEFFNIIREKVLYYVYPVYIIKQIPPESVAEVFPLFKEFVSREGCSSQSKFLMIIDQNQ